MQTMRFTVDRSTRNLMASLRADLVAGDDADLMRKALALAKVAMEAGRGSDRVVVIRGLQDSPGVYIDLRG